MNAETPFGQTLESDSLRVRICDNSERYIHISDDFRPGYNGLASLVHAAQKKNLFSFVGMNLEGVTSSSEAGAVYGEHLNARQAAMALERTGDRSCVLFQDGREACGFDTTIRFELGDTRVDQTITTSPIADNAFSRHFFASYLNQPQNTSIYMPVEGGDGPWTRFMEMTSPGHGAGSVFTREVDLEGKAWYDLLRDNPVRRQKIFRDEASIEATRATGFGEAEDRPLPTPFFFGLVDDFMLLYLFRENVFKPWISASGASCVRNPAWDYEIFEGPQKAGEEKTYHVRLVVKRYAGLADVLREVEAFRGTA